LRVSRKTRRGSPFSIPYGDLGATREEIIETLFNIIPYAGYPLIEKALLIAHDRISLFNEKQAADNAS
jgi:4-carboxymuconolactone decarboxylase